MATDSTLSGFRSLGVPERIKTLAEKCGLTQEDVGLLGSGSALPLAVADGMIENVVGRFELPYGVAGYFQVNGRDVLVPMAVEEPSIIAAASFMAKLARASGGFQTSSTGPIMRAQIQIMGIPDPYGARLAILRERQDLVDRANSRDHMLVQLGGGCKDLEVHVFPESTRGAMVVVHLIVDVRDAMGANTVNTMAEFVAGRLEEITGGHVRLRILSNLADLRLARARVQVPADVFTMAQFNGADVVSGMIDAYEFAAIDPYRAATHNKGILNGIDPIIVATGNDWRAIEAGAHAYACRSGRYTSLTTWEIANNGDLVGTLEMPMAVGLVGGATKTHPMARLSLKILGVKSAQELAEIAVAVGLAQNMGALRVLATEGVQRGHMALHARNIAINAGATGDEVPWLAHELAAAHDVRIDFAQSLLEKHRKQAH